LPSQLRRESQEPGLKAGLLAYAGSSNELAIRRMSVCAAQR